MAFPSYLMGIRRHVLGTVINTVTGTVTDIDTERTVDTPTGVTVRNEKSRVAEILITENQPRAISVRRLLRVLHIADFQA